MSFIRRAAAALRAAVIPSPLAIAGVGAERMAQANARPTSSGVLEVSPQLAPLSAGSLFVSPERAAAGVRCASCGEVTAYTAQPSCCDNPTLVLVDRRG